MSNILKAIFGWWNFKLKFKHTHIRISENEFGEISLYVCVKCNRVGKRRKWTIEIKTHHTDALMWWEFRCYILSLHRYFLLLGYHSSLAFARRYHRRRRCCRSSAVQVFLCFDFRLLPPSVEMGILDALCVANNRHSKMETTLSLSLSLFRIHLKMIIMVNEWKQNKQTIVHTSTKCVCICINFLI